MNTISHLHLYKIVICISILVTKIDLENIMKFDTDWKVYNQYLASPEKEVQSTTNLVAINAIENNVRLWTINMERVKFIVINFYFRYILLNSNSYFEYRLLLKVNSCVEKLKQWDQMQN